MTAKLVIGLMAAIAVAYAADDTFNLKHNMLKLNAELGEARERMIRNDKKGAVAAFGRLKTDVHDLLSNKSLIESLLPEGKRHKSNIAVESAKRIAENIEVIEDVFGENAEGLSPLKAQINAQRAFTSIEIACFHCHNLVRDQ